MDIERIIKEYYEQINIERIIKEYYEQINTHQSGNLDKNGQFFERHNLK